MPNAVTRKVSSLLASAILAASVLVAATMATINATTGNTDYASQTFPITDPGGTHRLYLVFQSVSGGPTTSLLNLNWVEFGGAGIGTSAT